MSLAGACVCVVSVFLICSRASHALAKTKGITANAMAIVATAVCWVASLAPPSHNRRTAAAIRFYESDNPGVLLHDLPILLNSKSVSTKNSDANKTSNGMAVKHQAIGQLRQVIVTAEMLKVDNTRCWQEHCGVLRLGF